MTIEEVFGILAKHFARGTQESSGSSKKLQKRRKKVLTSGSGSDILTNRCAEVREDRVKKKLQKRLKKVLDKGL